MSKLTKEQIFSMWAECQWGGGVDKRDYWTGHKEGFEDCIDFMIKEGYMSVTEKGKTYLPIYDESKSYTSKSQSDKKQDNPSESA